MANVTVTSTELLFLYDAASYALYTGNRALGQLSSTLINASLYGVLTLSVLVAGASLMPRSWRDIRNISLLVATGAMYAGTTIYFALRIRNLSHDMAAVYSNVISLLIDLQACYVSSVAPSEAGLASTCPSTQDVSDLVGPSDLPPQYCAGTAALTINAVLGNAILCWRACVVWPRRRMVPIVLGSLILATCADTSAACHGAEQEDPLRLDGPSVGTFFVGKSFGLAASSLSFVTVLAASSLICYKAWQRRADIRSRLREPGSTRSRMGRILALTIELGIVYCVIWAFVIGATTTMNQFLGGLEDPATGYEEIVYTNNPTSFVQGFWVFDLGALTPVTAIYPLLLVVVVALNKSHCESGFEYEHGREGFKRIRISDVPHTAGGNGGAHSPTQWRRKFLLASPEPAALAERRSASRAGVEVFALQKRSEGEVQE
ncbi:hypothetical protein LXA43DRAFT_386233 [Ganoderma leucocontextum]|nr:hypothetical protein LXA43DRAFT_386233 [Ganoderma leucocontextum]